MLRILIVDDDPTSLAVMRTALEADRHRVFEAPSVVGALDAYPTHLDLIISDLYMPDAGGEELLARARERDPNIPFFFLTAADDIEIAVELMRRGADDVITKPVTPAAVRLRVARIMEDLQRRRTVEEINRERELLALERDKIVNWRALYATKDTRQTEQLIENLSRTVNQSGGFMWLDMVEATVERRDDGTVVLPADVYTLILESGEAQRRVFEDLTQIHHLQVGGNDAPTTVSDGPEILEWAAEAPLAALRALAARHDRTLVTVEPQGAGARALGSVSKIVWSRENLSDILHELVCNAIKYSPEGSRIAVEWGVVTHGKRPALEFRVSNSARALVSRDDGSRVVGIPYDFRESVFDLFFTIESFPTYLDDERWRDGTGLFFARRLLARLGGWIEATSGVDYTSGRPEAQVTLVIRLPGEETTRENTDRR